MSLLDLTSEVLTEYRADASQHKAELAELKNFQTALGEEEGRVAAERNQGLNEWIETLGKVSLALVAVKEVGEVIFDGYKEGLKEARLETAATGVDIEKLGEAAGGLRTHLELLEFAAKANKSAFHNTQEDMENAERAMRALEQRGVPTAEAVDAVTTAVVTGRTKGLEPYGIVVDKHIKDLQSLGEENLTLAQKTEVHARAMEALKTVADEVSDSQENVGESMKAAEVKISDAWAEIKIQLGQLAVAFLPVIQALAQVAGYVHDITAPAGGTLIHRIKLLREGKSLGDDTNAVDAGMRGFNEEKSAEAMTAWADKALAPWLDYARRNIVNPDDIKIDNADYSSKEKHLTAAQLQELKDAAALPDAQTTLGTYSFGYQYVGGLKNPDGSARVPLSDMGSSRAAYEAQSKLSVDSTLGVDNGGLLDPKSIMAVDAGLDKVHANMKAIQADTAKTNKTALEKMFGKVDEIHMYKDAFDGLKQGVVSGYEAMVKGSESFSTAFKNTIAQTLLDEGKKMQILALENFAYGLASLAGFTLDGGKTASEYFAAAAAFEAGAIAAGVASNAMGAGKGGGSSGAKSSNSSNSSGSSSKTSGSNAPASNQPIIVYGDSFAADSPRSRQRKAAQLVQLAMGTNTVTNS